jgi:hypothetical protein
MIDGNRLFVAMKPGGISNEQRAMSDEVLPSPTHRSSLIAHRSSLIAFSLR